MLFAPIAEESPGLTVQPYWVLVALVQFIVLVFLLQKFLWGPVTAMLATRAAKIREGLDAALSAKRDREQMKLEVEQLLSEGIGDTVRVSLTVPFEEKGQEIAAGRAIIDDIAHGRFRSVPAHFGEGLNIISCPSCSRVENEAFVDLARDVKEMSAYAQDYRVTIAIMGCRVNGPGETDDADIGLWCGPLGVNLKRGDVVVGHYPYDAVLERAHALLDAVIRERGLVPAAQ